MLIQKFLIGFFIIVLITVIAYYFYVNYFFLYTTFTKKAPFVSSFDRHLKLMKSNLKLEKNKTIIDLGCGKGKALRFFIKNFNLKHGVGYDFDLTAILHGKVVNKMKGYKNIKLIHSKFEKADLKNFDYVYLYLWSNQLDEIENWLFSNIKKNAIVISNSFQFSKKKPFDIIKNEKGIDSIFLYK